MDFFADLDGSWLVDFGIPVSAGYWRIASQIFDPDGDASEVRPMLIISS